jgi:hypothetical protein
VSNLHDVGEQVGQDGLNALQLFAQTYKQADLTLTGTSRKAAYVQQSVAPQPNGMVTGPRRASTSSNFAVKDTHKAPPNSTDDVPDAMDIDTEERPPVTRPIPAVTPRKCVRCASDYSPRWWPSGRRAPLANGIGLNSASPSFHSRHPSQNSFGHLNGDVGEYECHKCHIKNPPADPVPDPRPSPYSAQRPMPANPAPHMPGHTFVSHSHPAPVGVPLGRPMPPAHSHSHGALPPGYPGGYEQRPPTDASLRNGMSPPVYAAPPPPPPHRLGSYPPTHPGMSASPYPSAGPPPPTQGFPTHQSPYGPMTARSPHLSQAPPRPYAASASPPLVSATVNRSPQTSLSALNGGPPPRMYSVDRGLGAPSHSPPVTQARLDPRGPTPPTRPEDTPPSLMGGPSSANRQSGVNGTSANSGASASPSLKNLLS